MQDFEKIYSDYYDTVFRYIRSLCKDETWAEEITQEAFFKALKSIHTFRGECKLSVWLCQIAKNTFLSDAKKNFHKVEEIRQDSLVEDSFEQKILNKETFYEVHQFLHQMSEPYKEVFWMRAFGELSFKEIGQLFEKSESWARVTYHRAKLKIREGLR